MPNPKRYQQIINAWCMYDWANSAFATTIMSAVLPAYYSQVAGANLPSKAIATSFWSLGLSLSLLVVAVLAPILGTISDITRGKKRFLGLFVGLGVSGTGLLVLVGTGDWLLASVLFVFGRIGFTGANVFYDALLPHVAKEEDRDSVSARGFAWGYLGGGLLLAANVVMLMVLPGTWGARMSFLSVALWWALFSIPIFRRVPEPPSATAKLGPGDKVLAISFKRIRHTLQDIRRYRELFKYLVAYLIYNDGIGTIIGVAVIYGAELGFADSEMILALLLVQFVGIPFSLVFGRLPNKAEKRRPLFLAFVLFNLVALPLAGLAGSRALSEGVTGAPLPAYEDTASAVGQGLYLADDADLSFVGDWQRETVSVARLGGDQDVLYQVSKEPGARYDFRFNGQKVKLTYSTGPDRGIWAVEMDGQPYYEDGEPLQVDAYHKTVRYDVRLALTADQGGEHSLSLINAGQSDESQGRLMTLAQVEVLPPLRHSNLLLIVAVIAALQLAGALFALVFGRALFSNLAGRLDTRRSIILALCIYAVISVWGYFINSTLEFWILAWMVAMVQGGSQALSRSLYASMSPAAKSGEFFGLYGVMEKFSAIIGPLLFATAAAVFGSSRPAVLSLIVLFLFGIFMLRRVDVDEGRRIARQEDAAFLDAADSV